MHLFRFLASQPEALLHSQPTDSNRITVFFKVTILTMAVLWVNVGASDFLGRTKAAKSGRRLELPQLFWMHRWESILQLKPLQKRDVTSLITKVHSSSYLWQTVMQTISTWGLGLLLRKHSVFWLDTGGFLAVVFVLSCTCFITTIKTLKSKDTSPKLFSLLDCWFVWP